MSPVDDEEGIFDQALRMPDAETRSAFLGRACGHDARLRQSVEALLRDHAQASELFRDAARIVFEPDTDAYAADTGEAPSAAGTRVGPYQIVRLLGQGGGGTVYEAEQAHPVRRKVALKVLKLGADHSHVLTRFEAERQAMEVMEHPNIARVLDAGITDALPGGDRPYFAVEFVEGQRITDYCRAQRLPLAARLRLVQQVCSAVQYAHQKGVIHCDLKPSNILIQSVDGTAVPKVIDFGIARVVAGMRDPVHAGPAGTPAYMSPEQRRGGPDVDTRSDIYSLGVVLRELLTDDRPPAWDDGASDDENDTTPETPAALPKRLDLAFERKSDRDLDWIVHTATHADRESRYATLRGLWQDLGRYLAHEPVQARPARGGYRLQKFVRRNLAASVAVVLIIVSLSAAFSVSFSLYLKANAAERKQAQLRAEAEERERVTKAAILLMQQRPAEADAQIRQMGGFITQPSVEATSVFRQLATWNARRSDWKTAAQRLLALSRVNRFDDADQTDNATRDLVALPPALVEAGEFDTYRQFVNMLLERFEQTQNPIAAEQVLKCCLLVEPPPAVLQRLRTLATVAERSLGAAPSRTPNRLEAWRLFAVGLWHYRAGDFHLAVQHLTPALDSPDADQAVAACGLAVRGMAYDRLRDRNRSLSDLTKARAMVDESFTKLPQANNHGNWNDWLYARILLKESAALAHSH